MLDKAQELKSNEMADETRVAASTGRKDAKRVTGMRRVAFALMLLALATPLVWGMRAGTVWISLANAYVALAAAGVAYLFAKVRAAVPTVVLGLLWLLFLPNTAYLFTDLGHMPYQWQHTVASPERVVFIGQYLLPELLGLATLLYALLPFEGLLARIGIRRGSRIAWLIALHFVVGYGVVLGRYEHVNAWVLLARPRLVLAAAGHILVSPDLLRLAVAFGLLCNVVYFLCRRWLLRLAAAQG